MVAITSALWSTSSTIRSREKKVSSGANFIFAFSDAMG
jgi:hypothetical protein